MKLIRVRDLELVMRHQGSSERFISLTELRNMLEVYGTDFFIEDGWYKKGLDNPTMEELRCYLNAGS